MSGHRLRKIRRGLLGGLSLFVLGVVASLFFRSRDRSSLLSPNTVFSNSGESETTVGSIEVAPSNIRLQEFHRVEVKDGKPVWEVRALEAKHFPADNLIHVNQASLKIYRPGEAPIEVMSKAARLFADNNALKSAVLEGDITVTIDGAQISAQLATFDVAGQVITAPDTVDIKGPGYEIHGDGLKFLVNTRQFELARNVRSEFNQGGRPPKDTL